VSASNSTLPLRAGDRLSREEFERRWEAMPHLKKAELIEGVVYLPEIGQWSFGCARADLIGWLGSYDAHTPGTQGASHPTVRLDPLNEPQPDSVLVLESACGGQTCVSADDLLEGAPELVAEVVPYPGGVDLETKLSIYRRHGVRECLVWHLPNRSVDWFVLRRGGYDRLALSAAGFFQSEVFPGLWLDPAALLGQDMADVLHVLQQGLASPEHTGFVAKLQQARKPAP
jgi:hypothetical protein